MTQPTQSQWYRISILAIVKDNRVDEAAFERSIAGLPTFTKVELFMKARARADRIFRAYNQPLDPALQGAYSTYQETSDHVYESLVGLSKDEVAMSELDFANHVIHVESLLPQITMQLTVMAAEFIRRLRLARDENAQKVAKGRNVVDEMRAAMAKMMVP